MNNTILEMLFCSDFPLIFNKNTKYGEANEPYIWNADLACRATSGIAALRENSS